MRIIRLGFVVGLCSAMAVSAQIPVSPGSSFFDRVRLGTDVAWLERIAVSDAALQREWTAQGGRGAASDGLAGGELRIDAFVRLGAIGSPESLAAIDRIERGMRGRRVFADASTSGWDWPAPAAGMGNSTLQPQRSLGAAGREYAVFALEAYGPYAPFLSWRDAAAAGPWSRPHLVGPPSPLAWSFDPHVELLSGGLGIFFRRRPTMAGDASPPPPITVRIDDIARDTDRDGWTDLEERQLGLDPTRADTDGDGLADDVDVTPLYPLSRTEGSDDEARVLQSAFFAAYGIRSSRFALFVPKGGRPTQLYGHAGPVLFGVDLPSRAGCGRRASWQNCGPILGGAEVTWQLGKVSPARTTIVFTNRMGTGFMSKVRLDLRKANGKWIVMTYALTYIT